MLFLRFWVNCYVIAKINGQMDLLNGEPIVELSGDEFLPIEGKTFTQQVDEFFKSQGGVANSPFGMVLLDKKSIQNSKSHGMSRVKASAFASVKDVLEKGVVINPMKQYHTNNKKNPTGMVAAPIMIGDEKYVCVVEVIANRQEQRLYVYEAFITKNLQEIAASNLVHRSQTTSPQSQGEIAKVLRNYIKTKHIPPNRMVSTNIFVDKDGNYLSANGRGADYVSENKNINCNRNMNKKLIRLTESDLHRIVRESVNKTLKEGFNGNEGFEKFAKYVYEANSALNNALSWLNESEPLRKNLVKAFNIVNETCYFIEQRRNKSRF